MPKGIIGRLDDMLIIRGVKFYPSDIEAILRSLAWLGTEFRIVLEERGALQEVTVEVEVDQSVAPSDFQAIIEEKLEANLGLRVAVEPKKPGTFPLTAFKARRVIDRRAGNQDG
jgi:phenylacetate-CoA ligase